MSIYLGLYYSIHAHTDTHTHLSVMVINLDTAFYLYSFVPKVSDF